MVYRRENLGDWLKRHRILSRLLGLKGDHFRDIYTKRIIYIVKVKFNHYFLIKMLMVYEQSSDFLRVGDLLGWMFQVLPSSIRLEPKVAPVKTNQTQEDSPWH